MKTMTNATMFDEQKRSIAKLMNKHAEGDERLAALLTVSIGRVFVNMARRGENWRSAYARDTVFHIADWIKAAILNNEAWLQRVDAKGRPLKLMKFNDIETITKEADKAMMKAVQKSFGIKLAEGDEELFATLEDGYYLARLMTAEALDKETGIMQHCVGNGAYDAAVTAGSILILSLRDKFGKPHATIEVAHKKDQRASKTENSTGSVREWLDFGKNARVIQIQGKQNKEPAEKYMMPIFKWLETTKWDIGYILMDFQKCQAKDGRIFSVFELPDGFESLYYVSVPHGAKVTLPDNMIANGGLYLNDSFVETLPKNLTVRGELVIDDTPIREIPACLKAEGGISASNSALETIYFSETASYLNVQGCKNFKFDKPVHVNGDLHVHGSGVISFPEGMTVSNKVHAGVFEFKDGAWPASMGDQASKRVLETVEDALHDLEDFFMNNSSDFAGPRC